MSDERLKLVLDFTYKTLLLLSIVGLAAAIALGDVKEVNSFGLQVILGCLMALAGAEVMKKSQDKV